MRVLQSFPEPRPTSNPYIVQLRDALSRTPGVEVETFSWRTALTGRYDVVHLHWPETLLVAGTPLRRAVRQAQFALWLLRMAITRTPVVRTVHNVELPDGLPRRDVVLLRALRRRARLAIRLNPVTDVAGARAVTIPHGDYRQWLAGYERPVPLPGRLAFVGQVRRYKGVETLLDAFGDAQERDGGLSLEIGGRPTSPTLEHDLRRRAGGRDDVRLDLRHLDDADLVRIVGSAELVVLPYRAMHNSGTVLYVLSLARPVLVPDNEVNRLLAAEVGPGWVHRFAGELDGGQLLDALHRVRAKPPAVGPDLSRRGWDGAGEAHAAAYRSAVGARG